MKTDVRTTGVRETIRAMAIASIALCALNAGLANAQTTGAPANETRAQSPSAAPPSRPRSDSAIVRDVRRAFTRTPGLNSAAIQVHSRNAFVTLNGRVPQHSQIQRAGNAARSVRGVRGVSNRLTVHPRGGRNP